MANKLKGEVTFDANGASLILVYSIDALIALEEHFDAGVSEIGAKLQGDLRASDLKIVFWAGLQQYQPQISQADAGLLLSEIGIPETSELVARAFVAAFAAPGEAAPGKAGPRKRRAPAAGTGPASTEPGAG